MLMADKSRLLKKIMKSTDKYVAVYRSEDGTAGSTRRGRRTSVKGQIERTVLRSGAASSFSVIHSHWRTTTAGLGGWCNQSPTSHCRLIDWSSALDTLISRDQWPVGHRRPSSQAQRSTSCQVRLISCKNKRGSKIKQTKPLFYLFDYRWPA